MRVIVSARQLAKLGFATLAVSVAAYGAVPMIQAQAAPAKRPAKAAPAAKPAAAANGAAQLAHGRQLFNDWSCGSCHTLKDASASGNVGPSLDGNKTLTKALAVNRITNGSGAMPAFGGQMSDQDIAALADYVVRAKK